MGMPRRSREYAVTAQELAQLRVQVREMERIWLRYALGEDKVAPAFSGPNRIERKGTE